MWRAIGRTSLLYVGRNKRLAIEFRYQSGVNICKTTAVQQECALRTLVRQRSRAGWLGRRRLGASRMEASTSRSSSVSSISVWADEDSGEAPATQDRVWPCAKRTGHSTHLKLPRTQGWVIQVGVSDQRCLDWPSCEATRLLVSSDSFWPWASIISVWTLDSGHDVLPCGLHTGTKLAPAPQCGSLRRQQSRPSACSLCVCFSGIRMHSKIKAGTMAKTAVTYWKRI